MSIARSARAARPALLAFVMTLGAGLLSPALGQEAPAPSPTPSASSSRAPAAPESGGKTQLFQVAMVVGVTNPNEDLDGDGKIDTNLDPQLRDMPGSVRKALQDLGDFLPYKGYRLLDTALIRTSRRGIANMRGPGGREFRVELGFRPGMGGGEQELIVQAFEVMDMTRTPGRKVEIVDSDKIKHSTETPPEAPKTIISTSFGMSRGETLVVGSSRLNGGNVALIMLVTATP